MRSETIGKISSVFLKDEGLKKSSKSLKENDFKEALLKENLKADLNGTNEKLKPHKELKFKFSNHAVERMRKRGITYSPQEMQSIEKAVLEAEKKGSKEALVLSDKSALIVSIKNKTVVTVMDKKSLKDNVFTNIDSTVII